MKQYILTCVNEDKKVVSTQAFATLGEAQEQMKREYDSHVDEFGDDDDMIEAYSIGSHAANLYYSQEDYEYHWEISNIDIPDSIAVMLMDKMMKAMIDVRQDREQMEEIFGEGYGYMASRLYPLHTFYNLLDPENAEIVVKYLLK